MRYLSYIFIFITYLNVGAQTSQYFHHTVTNASCNEENGSVTLSAKDLTLSTYPPPYYVELGQEGSAGRHYFMHSCLYSIFFQY